jgi:hypothetical protein
VIIYHIYHIEDDFFLITRREAQMVQSHDLPSPESGHFHEQYDSVGQPSQYRDNGMNTPTFTTISCSKTSALPITTTPAHEYQAQTVAGVFKVVLPVKMNIHVLTKIV